MPRLRFGDLLNDLPLIELARRLVRQEQTELEPHPATPQAPGPVTPASNTPTSKHAT
jgi:hypothetical protein